MDDGRDLESVALIDVFSEDDILLSSPRGVARKSGHIEESMFPVQFGDKSSVLLDLVPIPSDSPEPKNCTQRYNLRKSMAWDSAFFTSEGVLDAEELADVNNTFRNLPKQSLPGIPEDTRKSSESNADLDGEKWCIESGDANLIENLQASVRKSQTEHDRESSLSRSGASLNSASKNWRLSPQPKMKPSIASHKHGLSGQQSAAVAEESTSNTRVKAANESRAKKISPRPPRIASRTPIAPNRIPSGSVQSSPQTRKTTEDLPGDAGNSQPVTATRRPLSGGSCRVTPHSTLPGSSTNSHLPGSLSAGRSRVSSHDRLSRAPLERSKEKAARKVGSSIPEPANKCQVRDPRNKVGSINATPKPQVSSSISPSSSVESFTSGSSSSSASLARRPTGSPTALQTSSSFQSRVPPSHPNGHRPTSARVPQVEHQGRASSRTHLAANPSNSDALRCSVSNSGAKELKPSGLRLPSPKIGYFDAEKSQPPRGSSRNPQKSSRGNMLPRTASRLSTDAGAVDRQKLGKLQPAPKANPNNPQDSGAASLAVEESPEPCVDGSSRDIQTGSRAENSGGVEIAGDLRAPPAELSYEGKLASDGWARGLGDEPSPDLHEGARGSGGMAAALTI